MYRTGKTNWPVGLFFLMVGIIFCGAFYYLITVSLDPAYYRQNPPAESLPVARVTPPSVDKILLSLNATVISGNSMFVYKGTQKGHLLVDVLIPDLDRGYAYHHQIPLKTAKRGFNLAGQKFVLISANRRVAQIKKSVAN